MGLWICCAGVGTGCFESLNSLSDSSGLGTTTDGTTDDSSQGPSGAGTASTGSTASEARSSTSNVTVTSDDDTSATSSTSTGGPSPTCGNGVLDADEECDLGPNNGGACTPICTNAVCGDGFIFAQQDEACDDGKANAATLGSCAPDCSAIIEERLIRLNDDPLLGDMGLAFGTGGTLLDGLDDSCGPGFAAMFVHATFRVATATARTGDGQVDWPVRAWTQYVNPQAQLVWATDAAALIGVFGGAASPWMNPVAGAGAQVWVGAAGPDWLPAEDNCDGWSNAQPLPFDPGGARGDAASTDQAIFHSVGLCGAARNVYCVEL